MNIVAAFLSAVDSSDGTTTTALVNSTAAVRQTKPVQIATEMKNARRMKFSLKTLAELPFAATKLCPLGLGVCRFNPRSPGRTITLRLRRARPEWRGLKELCLLL